MKNISIIKKVSYMALVSSIVAIASGCAHRITDPITVNPEALVLTPDRDNNIQIDAVLNVPADYVTSRGMVLIEPELLLSNKVAEKFEPISLQGEIYKKKAQRLRALHHMQSSPSVSSITAQKGRAYSLPLRENINIENGFETGRVVAYVTKDGCDCQGNDTIVIAYLSNLSTLIDTDDLQLHWIDTVPPADGKYFNGEGQARLQFVVDKWDILPEMANNAAEMDSMLSALTPVLKDSLSTLKSMSIFGSASAEGGYKHNVELAQKRANSAKEWIHSKLNLTPTQLKIIKIGSEPEGWWPVVASMHAAGNPDSALVKAIIQKYPDVTSFEAERRIRKLACWPEIADKHLAKDRKVIYKYAYEVRAFKTDEEKLDMYSKRPDAFSEEEFLRVAVLKENNLEDLIDVYQTLLKYKPKSEIGINNLAVLYYDNGMYDEAIRLIEGQRNPSGDMITTLALCYTKNGDSQRAIDLLKGVATDEAIHNLGVIQASNHEMADAYVNLLPSRDLNTAIAALGIGENQEAWDILDSLDDNSEKAQYVRAIAQARLGNADKSIQYLKKAIKDPALKSRAAEEADFMPLHKEWKFQQLINE